MRKLHADHCSGELPPVPAPRQRYAVHPLFPLPDGVEEVREIHHISFDRWDHTGRKERCPDRFLASELTSLAQVVDRFGGGTYQFFAFDRRGNFSRWTAEKDKVRVGLPCKPLRPPEALELSPPPPPKAPAAAGVDLMALIIATQERTDRILMALLDHITARSARAAAQVRSPAAPSLDPVTMLVGLAAITGNQHPASGTAGEQLRALATIAERSAKNASAPAAPPSASPVPATPPTMVWAVIPGVGPALMRLDQARKLALRGAPPPSSPPPSPTRSVAVETAQPRAWSWNDVALRLKDPAEQLAFKAALERAVAAQATASAAPTRTTPTPSLAPASVLASAQAVPAVAPVAPPPRPAPPPSLTAGLAKPMPSIPSASAARAAQHTPGPEESEPWDRTAASPPAAEPNRATEPALRPPPVMSHASQWSATPSTGLARSRSASFPANAPLPLPHSHRQAYPRASPLSVTGA